MSLLFVPLTTVSMDSIPRERMGNATSLFNLMRNIGGSVGIATTGTLLARHSQATTSTLGSHVTMYDQASQSMFAQLRAGFMAAGADAVTATNRACSTSSREYGPPSRKVKSRICQNSASVRFIDDWIL